jgi:hypothetical protein
MSFRDDRRAAKKEAKKKRRARKAKLAEVRQAAVARQVARAAAESLLDFLASAARSGPQLYSLECCAKHFARYVREAIQAGDEFIAVVLPVEDRCCGFNLLAVGTMNPCDTPAKCRNDHRATPSVLAAVAEAAASAQASGGRVCVSERWAELLTGKPVPPALAAIASASAAATPPASPEQPPQGPGMATASSG